MRLRWLPLLYALGACGATGGQCSSTEPIFFLWMGGEMNEVQRLCINLAARHHKTVTLYCTTLDECPNAAPNVIVSKFDVEFFVGTPLQRWFDTTDLTGEGHRHVHLADAARLALLWHHGGTYLDTDMLLLKPLTTLPANAVGEEKYGHGAGVVSNAVMAFDAAHPFVWACMEAFAAGFVSFGDRSFGDLLSTGVWGQNGPKLLSRVLSKWPAQAGNSSVTVLPTSSFFHVPPRDILRYFAAPPRGVSLAGFSAELEAKGALAVHLWNQVSKTHQPEPGSAVHSLLHAS